MKERDWLTQGHEWLIKNVIALSISGHTYNLAGDPIVDGIVAAILATPERRRALRRLLAEAENLDMASGDAS
jgi:hypothetical protein